MQNSKNGREGILNLTLQKHPASLIFELQKAQVSALSEEKSRKCLLLLKIQNKSVEILKKPKWRKKRLLFDTLTQEQPKASNTKMKQNIPKIKVTEKASSQIYSQSSTNGRSFAKQCNLALYWGPINKYKRKTKDFSQSIEDHEREFDLLEQEIINSNPPKYIIESRSIIDKFSDLANQLFEVYSKHCNSILEDDKLRAYIKSELNRISLIYFSNLEGVKVIVSEGDEEQKSNIKKNNLLYEKYQENYISDLIDPSKSAVRLFLYNYWNNEHVDKFIGNADEDKSYMFEEMSQNR